MSVTAPAEAPRTRFDRADFLDAMERLHAYYISPMGLGRSGSLAINGGPDFLGLSTWIFDVYLAARSRGLGRIKLGIVVADITQTDEWLAKHPGRQPLTRPSFNPQVRFNHGEFLDVLQRLDGFYRAPEGLQRPNGLSISGGPDFLGIATWMFDVYLNERLAAGRRTSPGRAWSTRSRARTNGARSAEPGHAVDGARVAVYSALITSCAPTTTKSTRMAISSAFVVQWLCGTGAVQRTRLFR